MGRPGTRFPDAETTRRKQALDGLKQNILRNHQVSHGKHGQHGASRSTLEIFFLNSPLINKFFK